MSPDLGPNLARLPLEHVSHSNAAGPVIRQAEQAATAASSLPATSATEDIIRLRKLRRWKTNQLWRGLIPFMAAGDEHWEPIYNELTRNDPSAAKLRSYSGYQLLPRAGRRFFYPAFSEHASGLSDQQKADNLANTKTIDWSHRSAGRTRPPFHIAATLPLVEKLILTGSNLQKLPKRLPPNLRLLDVSSTALGKIRALPTTLQKLDISYTRMKRLNTLPEDLQVLLARHSQLRTITDFPESLKHAIIEHNELQELPPLPADLQQLNVANNWLLSLPVTPASLIKLEANGNKLRTVPDFSVHSPRLQHVNLKSNPKLQNFPAFSDALQSADLSKCGISHLPKRLPTNLQVLSLIDNPLGPHLDFPTDAPNLTHLRLSTCALSNLHAVPPSLRKLQLQNNDLRGRFEFPAGAENLVELDLRSNTIRELGPLPQTLRRLDLYKNNITTVPREWLEGPAHLEIVLKRNPIPYEEVQAVRELIEARRAAGLASPTIVFDHNGGTPALVDAYNLDHLDNSNSHDPRIVQIFRNQINDLRNAHPEVFAVDGIDPKALKAQIMADFAKLPSDPQTQRHGSCGLETFFNDSETEYAQLDFEQITPLTILAAVYRSIVTLKLSARVEATTMLQRHLGIAAGLEDHVMRCSTRHVEEVLTSITPYRSDWSAVSWEIARDTMGESGKALLRRFRRSMPSSSRPDETAEKLIFQTKLRAEIADEHPKISLAQIERFFDEVLPNWETFKELAYSE